MLGRSPDILTTVQESPNTIALKIFGGVISSVVFLEISALIKRKVERDSMTIFLVLLPDNFISNNQINKILGVLVNKLRECHQCVSSNRRKSKGGNRY